MSDDLPTVERARLLAGTVECFAAWLGPVTAGGLLDLVRAELGDARILDEFRPHGAHQSRARAASPIVHVVSGNTPHAALQSLLRGLLLGARNRVKLPSAGLPELERFAAALDPRLAARVELAVGLPEAWLDQAEALVVFGSDETIAHFHSRLRPGQVFQGHGHRASLGVVFDDFSGAAGAAAKTTALWDQRGCLSPVIFYVAAPADEARGWAGSLAAAFARLPADALSTAGRWSEEEVAHRAARQDWTFRAANDPRCTVWLGDDPAPLAWTVVFDGAGTAFPRSPLGRFIFVRPLPSDLPVELGPARHHLGALGFWPPGRAAADRAAALGLRVPRTCPLDAMQFPPLTWHQDGLPPLAGLVRWEDRERE